MPYSDIGPVALEVLRRIGLARASHLEREGKDLLWADLMRAMGWSQSTTSAIKNGKRPIDLEEVPDLARVLGVREAWLAVGDGPMRAPTPSTAAPPLGRAEDDWTTVHPPAQRDKKRRA